MASIIKRGSAWRVRIIRKGLPSISGTFQSKRDAQAWAASIEADIAKGVYVPPRVAQVQVEPAAPVLVADLLRRYREAVTPGKRGATVEQYRIGAMLAEESHAAALVQSVASELKAADVAAWRDRRLLRVAPSTVQKEVALLSSVYVVAASEWGFCDLQNPFRVVRRPTVNNGRDRRVCDAEIDLICENTESQELAALVRLALATCARRSELLSITWESVDLSKGVVRLAADATKNGHKRDLPLSGAARKVFAAMVRPLAGGKVFSLAPASVSQAFKRAVERARKAHVLVCAKAGKSPHLFVKPLNFHDLRHEGVSRYAELGLSAMEVSSISGHRTLALVQRYCHMQASHMTDKLAALAAQASA